MRHRKKKDRLGRDSKHTKSILSNLVINLIKRERIITTKKKAKALRSHIEKLISRARVDSLHNRRIVHKDVRDTSVLKKLFTIIAPRFVGRNGGYTRIYLLGARKGDGAESAIIEFVVDGSNQSDVVSKEVKTIETEPVKEVKTTTKKKTETTGVADKKTATKPKKDSTKKAE